jgi:hypothetical protein
MVLLGISLLGGGCTVDSGKSCPTKTVVLDAGIDGMPDVGEYASSGICDEVCRPLQSACRRAKELVFVCEPACI